MTKLRQKKHQRNFVAKNARLFNKSTVQMSKKDKMRHKKPKHKDQENQNVD